MKIQVMYLYTEPGVSFRIPKKVRDRLNAEVSLVGRKFNILEKIDTANFFIIVSTNSQVNAIQVKGPSVDKKNDCTNWGLFVPYAKVVKSNKPIEIFLEYFIVGVTQVFAKYAISERSIHEMLQPLVEEILGDSAYLADNEIKIPPPDLSDLGL